MTTKNSGSNPSQSNVRTVLSTVQHRIRKRNMLHGASIGVALGCFAAAMLACISVAIIPIAWFWLPIVALGAAVLGGITGAVIPASATMAAHVVDSYYVMKDRAVSALQFETDTNSIRQMQVADACRHLRQVRADDCVPIHPNRSALFSAITMATLAIGIVLFAGVNRGNAIDAQPVRLAADQASELRQTMLEEIEQLKEEAIEEPMLDELTEKLDELLEELATESIDERDMMATLSEMEQAISETRDAMKLEMTDAQLQGLAEAMQPSDAMRQAAAAMESGDYEKASDKLEQIDPADLKDKERRAVADNLKKFLAKLDPGQKGQLSGAAQQIQEGLEKKNDSQCKGGMCKLAGLCKKQGNCKKIGECMACQLNRLSQCKSQCRGACKNGGDKVAKSQSPSQKWGRGATGNPNDGEATRLDSTRREEQLSGVQGDGPSESEVLQAPEGEQDAVRQFAKKYQKFRSEAEAVLDSEPLPLGHRETVRQYFESIRPSNEEATQ
jgi:hypothetical protein